MCCTILSVIFTVESCNVKLGLLKISLFNLGVFQIDLLLLSQISMCRNFGLLEVTFQSLIYKSIQIMFVISKLSINKPVKVSAAWPPVFTSSGEIYFDNC
jgi:hypothetical protein